MLGLSAKQMKEFTDVIDNRIRNMINPTPMMKVAKVNSVQITTLTATFLGESTSVVGIPFTIGATFSTNDVVFVFTNQSQNTSSWLCFKVQQ